jgi:hypothetical protein
MGSWIRIANADPDPKGGNNKNKLKTELKAKKSLNYFKIIILYPVF